MKIYFVGGGNMTQAIIKGLINQKFSMSNVHIAEINSAHRKDLELNYQVKTNENFKVLEDNAILILAVKPDQLQTACYNLKNLLTNQLVISIVAGIKIKNITSWLGDYNNIIRAMPNLCAKIQKSITALYSSKSLSSEQHALVENTLQSIGKTLWVNNESKLDAVTALSGSGPAYIFYIINAFIKAGQDIGLSLKEAQDLSYATISGASLFAKDNLNNLDQLIQDVSSKGGTTEQAIYIFEQKKLNEIIKEAVIAAHKRSKKIGGE